MTDVSLHTEYISLTADSAVHTYLVVRVQLCLLPQQLQSHLPQEQGQAPQQLRKQTHVQITAFIFMCNQGPCGSVLSVSVLVGHLQRCVTAQRPTQALI